MALYHLSVKTVSRASGRSAVAAAAYRSGALLTNDRDGMTHDYTARGGVEETFIVAPDAADWAQDRAVLWNAAEAAENRKNSVVAREWEVALPDELSVEARRDLAAGFAGELVERYGVVADVAIHAPHAMGDARNHHAHILTTTREAGEDGLGAKTRSLDVSTSGEIEAMRERWAERVNAALELAQVPERVDHRSYARQGVEIEPTGHVGVHATGMERRAEREAEQTGQVYEPVTERGQENAAVLAGRLVAERVREEIAALKRELEQIAEFARETAQRVADGVRAGVEALAERVRPARQPEAEVEVADGAGDQVARWMAEQEAQKDDEFARIEAALTASGVASGAGSGDGSPARSYGIAEAIAESQRETAAQAREEAVRAEAAQRAAQVQREAQAAQRTAEAREQIRQQREREQERRRDRDQGMER